MKDQRQLDLALTMGMGHGQDWGTPLGDPHYLPERTYHKRPILHRSKNLTVYELRLLDADINPLHYY